MYLIFEVLAVLERLCTLSFRRHISAIQPYFLFMGSFSSPRCGPPDNYRNILEMLFRLTKLGRHNVFAGKQQDGVQVRPLRYTRDLVSMSLK